MFAIPIFARPIFLKKYHRMNRYRFLNVSTASKDFKYTRNVDHDTLNEDSRVIKVCSMYKFLLLL